MSITFLYRAHAFHLLIFLFLAGGCAGSPEVTSARDTPHHTHQVIYVSAAEDGIDVFRVAADSGELTRIQTVQQDGAVGALAISPDRQHLYASIRGQRAVATYAIDGATGELTLREIEPIGSNAVYLNVESTGRYLLSADYGGRTASSHAIADDGRVVGEPVQTVTTDRHAHAIVLDPTERFAFVPHTGPSAIFQFRFDAGSGRLTPNDPEKIVLPDNAGPRHFRFHPHLPNRAYSVNELDSSVTVFAFDSEAGTLRAIQNLPTLPRDFEGDNTCAEIHLTPDGRFLYASNRGHDSIAAYAVDQRTGELTFIDHAATEPRPRGFALDPNGRHLYAAGKDSDQLAAFRIDRRTGRLTRFATYATGGQPNWVQPLSLD